MLGWADVTAFQSNSRRVPVNIFSSARLQGSSAFRFSHAFHSPSTAGRRVKLFDCAVSSRTLDTAASRRGLSRGYSSQAQPARVHFKFIPVHSNSTHGSIHGHRKIGISVDPKEALPALLALSLTFSFGRPAELLLLPFPHKAGCCSPSHDSPFLPLSSLNKSSPARPPRSGPRKSRFLSFPLSSAPPLGSFLLGADSLGEGKPTKAQDRPPRENVPRRPCRHPIPTTHAPQSIRPIRPSTIYPSFLPSPSSDDGTGGSPAPAGAPVRRRLRLVVLRYSNNRQVDHRRRHLRRRPRLLLRRLHPRQEPSLPRPPAARLPPLDGPTPDDPGSLHGEYVRQRQQGLCELWRVRGAVPAAAASVQSAQRTAAGVLPDKHAGHPAEPIQDGPKPDAAGTADFGHDRR